MVNVPSGILAVCGVAQVVFFSLVLWFSVSLPWQQRLLPEPQLIDSSWGLMLNLWKQLYIVLRHSGEPVSAPMRSSGFGLKVNSALCLKTGCVPHWGHVVVLTFHWQTGSDAGWPYGKCSICCIWRSIHMRHLDLHGQFWLFDVLNLYVLQLRFIEA